MVPILSNSTLIKESQTNEGISDNILTTDDSDLHYTQSVHVMKNNDQNLIGNNERFQPNESQIQNSRNCEKPLLSQQTFKPERLNDISISATKDKKHQTTSAERNSDKVQYLDSHNAELGNLNSMTNERISLSSKNSAKNKSSRRHHRNNQTPIHQRIQAKEIKNAVRKLEKVSLQVKSCKEVVYEKEMFQDTAIEGCLRIGRVIKDCMSPSLNKFIQFCIDTQQTVSKPVILSLTENILEYIIPRFLRLVNTWTDIYSFIGIHRMLNCSETSRTEVLELFKNWTRISRKLLKGLTKVIQEEHNVIRHNNHTEILNKTKLDSSKRNRSNNQWTTKQNDLTYSTGQESNKCHSETVLTDTNDTANTRSTEDSFVCTSTPPNDIYDCPYSSNILRDTQCSLSETSLSTELERIHPEKCSNEGNTQTENQKVTEGENTEESSNNTASSVNSSEIQPPFDYGTPLVSATRKSAMISSADTLLDKVQKKNHYQKYSNEEGAQNKNQTLTKEDHTNKNIRSLSQHDKLQTETNQKACVSAINNQSSTPFSIVSNCNASVTPRSPVHVINLRPGALPTHISQHMNSEFSIHLPILETIDHPAITTNNIRVPSSADTLHDEEQEENQKSIEENNAEKKNDSGVHLDETNDEYLVPEITHSIINNQNSTLLINDNTSEKSSMPASLTALDPSIPSIPHVTQYLNSKVFYDFPVSKTNDCPAASLNTVRTCSSGETLPDMVQRRKHSRKCSNDGNTYTKKQKVTQEEHTEEQTRDKTCVSARSPLFSINTKVSTDLPISNTIDAGVTTHKTAACSSAEALLGTVKENNHSQIYLNEEVAHTKKQKVTEEGCMVKGSNENQVYRLKFQNETNEKACVSEMIPPLTENQNLTSSIISNNVSPSVTTFISVLPNVAYSESLKPELLNSKVCNSLTNTYMTDTFPITGVPIPPYSSKFLNTGVSLSNSNSLVINRSLGSPLQHPVSSHVTDSPPVISNVPYSPQPMNSNTIGDHPITTSSNDPALFSPTVIQKNKSSYILDLGYKVATCSSDVIFVDKLQANISKKSSNTENSKTEKQKMIEGKCTEKNNDENTGDNNKITTDEIEKRESSITSYQNSVSLINNNSAKSSMPASSTAVDPNAPSVPYVTQRVNSKVFYGSPVSKPHDCPTASSSGETLLDKVQGRKYFRRHSNDGNKYTKKQNVTQVQQTEEQTSDKTCVSIRPSVFSINTKVSTDLSIPNTIGAAVTSHKTAACSSAEALLGTLKEKEVIQAKKQEGNEEGYMVERSNENKKFQNETNEETFVIELTPPLTNNKSLIPPTVAYCSESTNTELLNSKVCNSPTNMNVTGTFSTNGMPLVTNSSQFLNTGVSSTLNALIINRSLSPPLEHLVSPHATGSSPANPNMPQYQQLMNLNTIRDHPMTVSNNGSALSIPTLIQKNNPSVILNLRHKVATCSSGAISFTKLQEADHSQKPSNNKIPETGKEKVIEEAYIQERNSKSIGETTDAVEENNSTERTSFITRNQNSTPSINDNVSVKSSIPVSMTVLDSSAPTILYVTQHTNSKVFTGPPVSKPNDCPTASVENCSSGETLLDRVQGRNHLNDGNTCTKEQKVTEEEHTGRRSDKTFVSARPIVFSKNTNVPTDLPISKPKVFSATTTAHKTAACSSAQALLGTVKEKEIIQTRKSKVNDVKYKVKRSDEHGVHLVKLKNETNVKAIVPEKTQPLTNNQNLTPSVITSNVNPSITTTFTSPPNIASVILNLEHKVETRSSGVLFFDKLQEVNHSQKSSNKESPETEKQIVIEEECAEKRSSESTGDNNKITDAFEKSNSTKRTFSITSNHKSTPLTIDNLRTSLKSPTATDITVPIVSFTLQSKNPTAFVHEVNTTLKSLPSSHMTVSSTASSVVPLSSQSMNTKVFNSTPLVRSINRNVSTSTKPESSVETVILSGAPIVSNSSKPKNSEFTYLIHSKQNDWHLVPTPNIIQNNESSDNIDLTQKTDAHSSTEAVKDMLQESNHSQKTSNGKNVATEKLGRAGKALLGKESTKISKDFNKHLSKADRTSVPKGASSVNNENSASMSTGSNAKTPLKPFLPLHMLVQFPAALTTSTPSSPINAEVHKHTLNSRSHGCPNPTDKQKNQTLDVTNLACNSNSLPIESVSETLQESNHSQKSLIDGNFEIGEKKNVNDKSRNEAGRRKTNYPRKTISEPEKFEYNIRKRDVLLKKVSKLEDGSESHLKSNTKKKKTFTNDFSSTVMNSYDTAENMKAAKVVSTLNERTIPNTKTPLNEKKQNKSKDEQHTQQSMNSIKTSTIKTRQLKPGSDSSYSKKRKLEKQSCNEKRLLAAQTDESVVTTSMQSETAQQIAVKTDDAVAATSMQSEASQHIAAKTDDAVAATTSKQREASQPVIYSKIKNAIHHKSEWSIWYSSKRRRGLSAVAMNKLECVLNAMWNMDASYFIKYPVKSKDIHNYYEQVKHPMCLKTMGYKLKTRIYETIEQFVHDMRRIFFNAKFFNKNDAEYINLTTQLEAAFNILLEEHFFGWDFGHITGDPNETVQYQSLKYLAFTEESTSSYSRRSKLSDKTNSTTDGPHPNTETNTQEQSV